jgi:uncharacterized protein YbbC (DUF1343 family)
VIKALYPRKFQNAMDQMADAKKELFNKVNGTSEVWDVISNNKYVVWPLRKIHEERRAQFAKKRKRYLMRDYAL